LSAAQLNSIEYKWGISRVWLETGKGEQFTMPSTPAPPSVDVRKLEKYEATDIDYEYVPILAEKAAAGLPSIVDNEYVEDVAIIHRSWLTKGRHVCFRIRGDSMAPIIGDDFMIAVNLDRNDPARLVGQIVLAYLWEGITVKWLTADRGQYMLVPENQNYAPVIMDSKDVRILGAVEWWFGRPPKPKKG